MGDNEYGPTNYGLFDGLLHQMLGLSIERGRRFVQNKNAGTYQQGSGNRLSW